jgi:Pyridoxamine 5'-phosphate oxidase
MRGVVQSLTRDQCLCRLARHRVGRVSVSRDALPLIVVVSYWQDGDSLVLRSPLDAGFGRDCDNAVIAFEVGDIDDDSAWSVHVVGIATMQTDHTARIRVERVTGRLVFRRVDADLPVVGANGRGMQGQDSRGS